MKQRKFYKEIEEAVEAQRLDAAAVDALSAEAVRTLAGKAAEGATATLVANMRRAVAAELRQKEMAAAAAWVETQVRVKFAAARAVVRSSRCIEVLLDGVAKEVQ